jgi:hypothetical protein
MYIHLFSAAAALSISTAGGADAAREFRIKVALIRLFNLQTN